MKLVDREEKDVDRQIVDARQRLLEDSAIGTVRVFENRNSARSVALDPLDSPVKLEAVEWDRVDLLEPGFGEITIGLDVEQGTTKKIPAILCEVENLTADDRLDQARNRRLRDGLDRALRE